ncbi:hypothetical protein CYY_007533 [Polysphondylium violaceum]|uniref:SANT domain-containing protein n=1 Tax=Polysphondylium violaceum TaxID=133409 RepID=A0A8J4UXY9_9MYCE|nr:hypothetical protein CYY_007533 [Polysphondylium violaceum]
MSITELTTVIKDVVYENPLKGGRGAGGAGGAGGVTTTTNTTKSISPHKKRSKSTTTTTTTSIATPAKRLNGTLILYILYQLMNHSRALNILFKGVFLVFGVIVNDWIEYHRHQSLNIIYWFFYYPSRQPLYQHYSNNNNNNNIFNQTDNIDTQSNDKDYNNGNNDSNNNRDNDDSSNNNNNNNSNNNNNENNSNNNSNSNINNSSNNNNNGDDKDEKDKKPNTSTTSTSTTEIKQDDQEEEEEEQEQSDDQEFLNLDSYAQDPFTLYDPPELDLQDPYTDYNLTTFEPQHPPAIDISSQEGDDQDDLEKRKRDDYELIDNSTNSNSNNNNNNNDGSNIVGNFDLTLLEPQHLLSPKKIKLEQQINNLPTTTTTTISNVSPHFSQIRYTSPSFIDGDGSINLNNNNINNNEQQQDEEPPYQTVYPHKKKEIAFERKPSERLQEQRRRQQIQQQQLQKESSSESESDSSDSDYDTNSYNYKNKNNLPAYIRNRADNIPLFMGPFEPATDGEAIPTLPVYQPILPPHQVDLFIERATEILEAYVPQQSHITVENIPVSSILELLPQHNYDCELALESINESTLQSMTLSLEDEIHKKWSPQDKDRFYKGFIYFGRKKFKDIANYIQTKSIQETIEYYYFWKQYDEYKLLKEQGFKPHFDLKSTITSSCFPTDPDSFTGKLKLNLVNRPFEQVEEVGIDGNNNNNHNSDSDDSDNESQDDSRSDYSGDSDDSDDDYVE